MSLGIAMSGARAERTRRGSLDDGHVVVVGPAVVALRRGRPRLGRGRLLLVALALEPRLEAHLLLLGELGEEGHELLGRPRGPRAPRGPEKAKDVFVLVFPNVSVLVFPPPYLGRCR